MTRNAPIKTFEITPAEFELQVKTWLQNCSKGLKEFSVTNLKKVEGYGGEYELDAVAEFQVFRGASRNGREGETATFLSRYPLNSMLRGNGFAPRHLGR